MEALELFAAEVMPEFAARHPEREAAKRARLGDAPVRALERGAARQTVAPGYAFGPGDGAPPAERADTAGLARAATGSGARLRVRLATRAAGLRRAAEGRAEHALQAFVKRSGDRRLEQTIGSRAGLKAAFSAMERRFVPERAAGFTGDIQYDLRAADGRLRSFTVTVDADAAKARPGTAAEPKLKITMALADFVRLAGGDLDPVKAVLTGRLELAGDFAVAMRLGEMFGQPPPF
jgi:putative sterol carrier protein